MAKSGLQHADVGDELSKAEWLSEESHQLVHGNAFPDSPVERQLYYRDDEHTWYIRTNSAWVSLQAGAASTFLALTDTPAAYTGQAGKYTRVNTGETALEFATPGGSGDMLKSTYDPDEDGVIALAQLASAVCSETEADGKISTHTAIASAHHVKTADDEVYGLLRMGTDAGKPAAGIAGRFYYATDTMILFRDTGGAWTEAARAETKSRLAELFEKAHSSLSGIGASDHHSNVITITFIIDGGGSAIATGQKGHLEIPFACTITGWTILADQAGSIVVDVWKDTYANFPPTVADTIAGSEKPTLSSAQKNQDLSLSTWTTAIAAGDILAFNVDSASTVTRVTISIRATKT